MTDKQLQAKLNKLANLANELDDEAKRRYGKQGSLFFESGGWFYINNGDITVLPFTRRQSGQRLSSNIWCKLGAGAF